MKNKKGFTLVELLAVIIILGVLLMIAVPAVQNVIKKTKNNATQKQAKLSGFFFFQFTPHKKSMWKW